MTNMSVPFFRPSIGEEEISEVVKCLQSGWLTTGPNSHAFEQEFSAMFEDDEIHAIAVNSATAALHLGLEALGIGQGDEVIVPTLTFTATAEVVRYLGADPVFVDIDADTLCIDIDKVKKAISSKTKVIMPVHFAGRPCDMTAIKQLAKEHGLRVLDDAAHALPTKCNGKLIGEIGADVTAFSFYANKTMTTGEGGMLVTRDDKIAARARTMRLHGIDRDVFNRFSDVKASWMYDVIAPGYKYNLTDVAAAMGRVQLRRIETFRADRMRLANRYTQELESLPLVLPSEPRGDDMHSWHLYIVQLKADAKVTRGELIKELTNANIGTSVHYRPLHQMTFWANTQSEGGFPVADAYFDNCVTLPLFMSMSDEEQNYVIDVLKRVLS